MATPVIRQKGHLPSKIFALPLFYEKENAYYETWKIVLWDHHTGNLLYADGLLVDGALANKYHLDAYILPVEAKGCILFLVLAVMEYGIFCYCSRRSIVSKNPQ